MNHRKPMTSLILKFTEIFKDANLSWAIGGSNLLALYEMTDQVHDLDIIVDSRDHDRVCDILTTMGKKLQVADKGIYLTERFSRYEVEGIEVEVMSDFKIKYPGGIFTFILDTKRPRYVSLSGCLVPVTDLEQWYLAYLLMDKRQDKVAMIEKYYINNPSIVLEKITHFLQGTYPRHVLDHIHSFIASRDLRII